MSSLLAGVHKIGEQPAFKGAIRDVFCLMKTPVQLSKHSHMVDVCRNNVMIIAVTWYQVDC